MASRDHVRHLLPLVREALAAAESDQNSIDAIAYTAGPGLIGALLVGAGFASGLALAWGKPTLGIHHLEGHLLAPLLEPEAPAFPFLALLVSGGHTQLVDVAALGKYRILGETLDDAAGEAFDKTAKLLGLPYPGGAALAALAERGRSARRTPRCGGRSASASRSWIAAPKYTTVLRPLKSTFKSLRKRPSSTSPSPTM